MHHFYVSYAKYLQNINNTLVMHITNNEFEIALKYMINNDITAYEINKFSGLSETGLRKVLEGEVKKPRNKTKEAIVNFYKSIVNRKNDTVKSVFSNKEEEISKDSFPLLDEHINIIENTILFSYDELVEKSEVFKALVENLRSQGRIDAMKAFRNKDSKK